MRNVSSPLRILLIITCLCMSAFAQAQYAVENLTPFDDIDEGLSLAHAKDGRIFIAERDGDVKVYQNNTVSTVFSVSTTTDAEQGLLGLTLHPDFTENGYMYVFYTRNDAYHHIIERVQVSPSNQELGRMQLLTLDPIQGGFHNGGDLAFFNGYLFITTGDSQNNENSQNLDNYRGKILRITENGQPAPGNPFYGSGSVQRQSIWAYGFRNPFRLVVNNKLNKLFTLDVGTSWEEINDVTSPGPLYNYGWGHPNGGDGAQSETDLFINPVFAFRTGSLGNALTNGLIYNPDVSRYPAELYDQFLFKDYVRTEIRRFDWTAADPISSVFYDSPHNRALGMSVGIDGYIYYSEYGSRGNLIRLVYENAEAPSIINHPLSQSIVEQSPVRFTVDVTGAPPLSYQWQFNGVNIDGANQQSFDISSVRMEDAGQYRCIVTNSAGSATSNAATLTVQEFNNAPSVSVSLPLPSLSWNADDVIAFAAEASDVEDGELPASAFSWSIDLYHEDTPGAGHSHPGASPSGVKGGNFVAANQGEKSPNIWYRFLVTVTDSAGLTASDYVEIHPNLITATANTNPEGLMIELNQKPATSPTSQQLVVNGDLQALNAPTPQFIGDTRYDFVSWEHGGGATQTFNAPASDVVYTAHYEATNVSQQPYLGNAAQIPGDVEAEYYDEGVGAYYDLNGGGDGGSFRGGDGVGTDGSDVGGYHISWVVDGEWLEYTVNVTETANYTVNFETASPYDNRVLHLEVDGVDVTGPVNVPNSGGFQNWVMTPVSGVFLSAGTHILRLQFDANDINMERMVFSAGGTQPDVPTADFEMSKQQVCSGESVEFTSVSLGNISDYVWEFGEGATPISALDAGPHEVIFSGAAREQEITLSVSNAQGSDSHTSILSVENCVDGQSPFSGSAATIPGSIEAEHFDLGGEGVAYHDASANNAGGAFRTDEYVDIENSATGGLNIGWVDTNEWLEYSVNVLQSGLYDVSLLISTPYTDKSIRLEMDGVDVTGSISLPQTGGWQDWQTVTLEGVNLNSGPQVLRLVFEADSINLDSFSFASGVATAPNAQITLSAEQVCIGESLTVSSASSGAISSYLWQFGDSANPPSAASVGPHELSYSSVGEKVISLTVGGEAGSDSASSVLDVVDCQDPEPQSEYQAEDAIVVGASVQASHDNFTGTGFVDYQNASGDYIEWNISVAATGSYYLNFDYALAGGNRPLDVIVDGVSQTLLDFPATGSWSTWQSAFILMELSEGAHVVRLSAAGSSGPNVDRLRILQ